MLSSISWTDSARQRWHLKIAMKNIERSSLVRNGMFLLFDARWPINNFLEPKPSRSSSSQDGSSSYATDDRSDRQLAPQNSLSNMGLAPELSGSSDCILHVICSPMVHKSSKKIWLRFHWRQILSSTDNSRPALEAFRHCPQFGFLQNE